MAQGDNLKGGKLPNSGRKKGQPNKLTADIRAKLAAAFERGTDAMIALLEDDSTDARVRVEIWKTMGKKVVPDVSAVTLNPDADGAPQPVQIVLGTMPTTDDAGNPL